MSLQNYIIDSILRLEPWLNTSTVCSFPQPWHPHSADPVPVYEIGLKPSRNWTVYAGHLLCLIIIFYRYGFGSWRLHPQTTPDLFYGKGLGVNDFYDMNFVVFEAASDLITHLVVKGFNRSLPPVFQRVRTPVDEDGV
ncbi:unnamed protein product, partial [Candidula unifasciata]